MTKFGIAGIDYTDIFQALFYMKAIYEAVLGYKPTGHHLLRLRLLARRDDWNKTITNIIATNKSLTYHHTIRRSTATSVAPKKLHLFGK